jgi:hypothetical protein
MSDSSAPSPSNSGSDGDGPAGCHRHPAGRRGSSGKRNLRHRGPLQAGLPRPPPQQAAAAAAHPHPRSTGELSDATSLQRCEALYQRLPRKSRWARHRLLVLETALGLLRTQRATRTTQQARTKPLLPDACRPRRCTPAPAHHRTGRPACTFRRQGRSTAGSAAWPPPAPAPVPAPLSS